MIWHLLGRANWWSRDFAKVILLNRCQRIFPRQLIILNPGFMSRTWEPLGTLPTLGMLPGTQVPSTSPFRPIGAWLKYSRSLFWGRDFDSLMTQSLPDGGEDLEQNCVFWLVLKTGRGVLSYALADMGVDGSGCWSRKLLSGRKKETTDFRPRRLSYSFKKCQPGMPI